MIRRCVLCLALIALAVPAFAQVPVLVDVDWLAQNLNSARVIVLHRGRNYSTKHIPGARDLQGTVTLASLASLGVSNDSHIVIYSANPEIPAPLTEVPSEPNDRCGCA